jgi:hypothetical protein
LLSKLDFIIKNKTEKKNDVATFKREMALQYETFYNDLEYRKLRFHRYEMIHNLTTVDNYCEYDALKYIVDYNKLNLIVLDIINNKYLDITYTENNLGPNTSVTLANENWYVVIKYVNSIYLPLMRSNGKHYFDNKFLEVIKNNYEREFVDKFKEPSSSIFQNNITQKNITDYEKQNLLNTSDTSEQVDNILDCNTVSIFFNNTIPINNQLIINRNEDFSFAIEDMIDIEEQESEPMGLPIDDSTTSSIPIISIIPSKITAPKEVPIIDVKQDIFTDFMNKIPMKSSISAKKTYNKSHKNIQSKVKTIEKTENTNITLESVLNTVLTNNVDNAVNKPENLNYNSNEEIKPIGKYNLGELQHLAKVYKINTQKEGKTTKMINKTKEELYNEIKETTTIN